MSPKFLQRIEAGWQIARARLIESRNAAGHWSGELSSSALSTATAVTALAVFEKLGSSPETESLIGRGLGWLAGHSNPDGGWGDTVCSRSNISTTTLVWAAFGAAARSEMAFGAAVAGAENWLKARAGGLEPERMAAALLERYGQDRTFSAPILTMCALAGRLGPGPEAWKPVVQLPFELAVFPRAWFGALRLPVVSYALPALIAIGQVRHHFRPTRNFVLAAVRRFCWDRAMRVLEQIQPAGGGFLEAVPLTSFVVMSLAASGRAGHPVSLKGISFLKSSARADGSWPIDTNLSTWVTTLSVEALEASGETALSETERGRIGRWLIEQQYRQIHPYTNAAPGGWAWTDSSGGVPDADDTAGALLALKQLGPGDREILRAAVLGVRWLLELQNRDGGIPTFCRGWGKLPFDRSSPDLTAHAMRAWTVWQEAMDNVTAARIEMGLRRAVDFLIHSQNPDGSWTPLWFGSEQNPSEENWTYGTSRVLLALAVSPRDQTERLAGALEGGLGWLVQAQNRDGSWGGGPGIAGSVEETALALEALAALPLEWWRPDCQTPPKQALMAGCQWLTASFETGEWKRPAPIGFYFAKLWYFEKLYPLIFTTAALGRIRRKTRELFLLQA